VDSDQPLQQALTVRVKGIIRRPGPPVDATGPGLATTRWAAGHDHLTNAALAAWFGSVAITPAQFYLFAHVAAYIAGRVHRAVPSDQTDKLPSKAG
jgi:hypothetical protein